MALEKRPEPQKLSTWQDEMAIIGEHIKSLASGDRTLNILEAGCGRRWALDLKDVNYCLTGVDMNKDALDCRITAGDLNEAILGDLHTVDLKENSFDVIYNSNVLEHVNGAEKVLDRFTRWLKPGGVLTLRIPNRDSAKGYLTRVTPFWFHVFYKRYIQGYKDAGTPGNDPFPTYFDKVVSKSGIHKYCDERNLAIVGEYYIDDQHTRPGLRRLSSLALWLIHAMSLGKLSMGQTQLVYIIKRKVVAEDTASAATFPGLPASSPELPASSPEVPASSPEVPASSPEVPASSPAPPQ